VSWRDFWNGEHAIYANDRHRLLHDRFVARDIVALIPRPDAVVLDYGCGEATAAAEIAARCGRLLLCDAAPTVRARLAQRFAGHPAITVLSPDEADDLADGSVDLMVVNSVVQYLSRPELDQLLALAHAKLRPGGRLVLADIVPNGQSPFSDAAALLRFAAQGGFLLAAMSGLARTFFSDYRKLRSDLGLATYDERQMLAVLRDAGFEASRHHPNLGHNQGRMSFVASPRPAA
jgi:SAM-dependent methyltransferase